MLAELQNVTHTKITCHYIFSSEELQTDALEPPTLPPNSLFLLFGSRDTVANSYQYPTPVCTVILNC